MIPAPDVGRPGSSFREEVIERATVRDIGLLLIVPTLLGLVFFLPASTREALVFGSVQPSVVTAFTAHYVHLTFPHLLGNLIVYAGAVGVGYPLALLGNARRLYISLVLAVLLAYPFVLSTIQLATLGSGRIVGFSGLALALVGLLPVVLFVYLQARIEGSVSVNDAPALFFFGTAAIAWRTAAPNAIVHPLAITSAAIGVLYVVPIGLRLARTGWETGPQSLRWGYVELPVAAVLFYFLALALGFPLGPLAADGPTTSLVLHLFGHALGFVGAYLADRTVRSLTPPATPPPPPPD